MVVRTVDAGMVSGFDLSGGLMASLITSRMSKSYELPLHDVKVM